jgi:endonuclease/exonuclease/phosphatase family metal-dependent hydrolase
MTPPLTDLQVAELSPDSMQAAASGREEATLRVGVLNTRMLPFSSAGRRADLLAARVLAGDFDIVSLSEVFSETGRSRLVELLEESYPHRVEYIGSRELHRLDSGLMLFSRLPLRSIPDSIPHRTVRLRGEISTRTEPDSLASFIRFAEFDHCARADCWAAKGVGYVTVDIGSGPLHLFFTHMQASYGGDDESWELETAAIRSRQRLEMAHFIRSVAGSGLRLGEQALLVGDLNVDGSADITGGVERRTALVGDERARMLRELSGAFPAGLSDTWRDFGPPGDPGLTFPVRSLNVRFDYVLASLASGVEGFCVDELRRAFGLDASRGEDAIDIAEERRVTDHVGLVIDLRPNANGCGPLAGAARDGQPSTGIRSALSASQSSNDRKDGFRERANSGSRAPRKSSSKSRLN